MGGTEWGIRMGSGAHGKHRRWHWEDRRDISPGSSANLPIVCETVPDWSHGELAYGLQMISLSWAHRQLPAPLRRKRHLQRRHHCWASRSLSLAAFSCAHRACVSPGTSQCLFSGVPGRSDRSRSGRLDRSPFWSTCSVGTASRSSCGPGRCS